jgi:comEA protein
LEGVRLKLIRPEKVAIAISAVFILAAVVTVLTCTPAKNRVQVTASQEMRSKTISDAVTEETELININTASADELCALPGIGESTAQKIIAYRTQYGAFRDISSIIDVSGIGLKTFEKIKDKITV